MDVEAIELMEITSKDIDTTVKGVELETPFTEPGERQVIITQRIRGIK